MRADDTYPPSLILEGPLFNDELVRQPQALRQQHDIDTLRLIPSKSAASGVHTIYFHPDHRQWALVRLATRYRGLFEIQLQRGMVGERQLFKRGFESADVDFLFDIIPQSPESYSTIVYDMLWLAATYPQYKTLASHLQGRSEFVPRDLLKSSDELSLDDTGFFTRFLRSHIIVETESQESRARDRSSSTKSGLKIKLDSSYSVTTDGREALEGIVAEYDRIFVRQEFEPLLINPDLDPYEHLRAHIADQEDDPATITLSEIEDNDNILGEIASSFAPLDDTVDPTDDAESLPDSSAESSPSSSENSDLTPAHGTHVTSGPIPDGSSIDERSTSTDLGTTDSGMSNSDGETTEVASDHGFTDAEVRTATVAAAQTITENSLARTDDVKEAVWKAVDLGDRSRGDLWETVLMLLLEMDIVHGREGGHIWAASKFRG